MQKAFYWELPELLFVIVSQMSLQVGPTQLTALRSLLHVSLQGMKDVNPVSFSVSSWENWILSIMQSNEQINIWPCLQRRTLTAAASLGVCMARRRWCIPGSRAHGQETNGRARAAQYTSCHVYFLFCTLLEQELWGKDWFLYENNTGEKGHLPLSAVSFFTYWLAPFKFTLMSTLWVKANKSLRMTAFAQYLLCMHGQGFLGLQDQFCSLCPV